MGEFHAICRKVDFPRLLDLGISVKTFRSITEASPSWPYITIWNIWTVCRINLDIAEG